MFTEEQRYSYIRRIALKCQDRVDGLQVDTDAGRDRLAKDYFAGAATLAQAMGDMRLFAQLIMVCCDIHVNGYKIVQAIVNFELGTA